MAINIGHVLHLEAPHKWLPGDSCDVIVRVVQTKRFLKFLERRKAINGGCRSAFRNHFRGVKNR